MTAARNCQALAVSLPKPHNRTTQTPSGRATRGRWTPARGVRMAVQMVRDNRELAVLVATFLLALVLGLATRGMAWVVG